MRYYLRINPDTLSDAEWAETWQGLLFAIEFDNKRLNANIDNAIGSRF